MKNRNNITTAILLALGLVALCPTAQAVSPAPDGGYAGNNTAEGTSALFSLSSGVDNTGLGFQALFHNTTGNYNTAEGFRALFTNTTGTQNTATGVSALISNTGGNYNTADGVNALYRNTTGTQNTAVGVGALFSNIAGSQSTAVGYQALYFSNVNAGNTATGYQALYHNTTGFANTANGLTSLYYNTTGGLNSATGNDALVLNTTGGGNTANGVNALDSNTTGSNNVAIGYQAGGDLTTGDNNVDIGYNVTGVAGEANTIRIGNTAITDTYIRGINGVTVSGGTAVYVNSNGKLGTSTSSARFKDEIKPMGNASEAILALRPVSFRYKKEIDPNGVPQFGLVAEEVEKVNRDLIIRDGQGKPQTVRYEQINAMLLNEFLKEHRKVEKLENDFQTTVARQQKEIWALTAQLKEQAAQIRKVSAQIHVNKAGPGVVANDPQRAELDRSLQ